MDAERILVIILSGTLALFLLLAIIATVKIIQILNHLKTITEKAERVVNTAENIGDFFKHTSSAAAVGNLLSNIIEAVKKRKKKGE